MKSTPPSLAPALLRSRLTKVCVAIIGGTPAEMIDKATAAVKENPFIEFRLDYLDKPLGALPRLKQFFAENTAVTAIATCRREANGGKFTGSLASEVEVLSKAAENGFHLADLELESAEALKPAELQKLRETGIALILSYHDFKGTGDLEAIYTRIQRFSPDFVKIVPTATSLADNLTLIRFLEHWSDHTNIVGVAMGDAGVISRVLGVRAGSAFTFAAASAGEETAPGQIAARTLLETYRIDQVDAATRIYGVAGHPIRSSLSPIMMNTAFRRETVNAVYLALQTASAEDLIRLVREIPIQGVSVTMPLKQDVIPHLAQTDPLSAKIGAVNTIRLLDGKLYGFNTDVAGITVPLEKRLPLRGAKVLVLGAGGAARAAVFAAREKGAEVHILNRTAETAQKLAKQSGSKVLKREALAKSEFDVLINATPIGMAGNNAPQLIEAEDLAGIKLVFDLVYNPLETPLLRLARQAGISIITGVEMFVQQGVRQFEIFTGKPAPEEEMFRVVLHSLRQQSEASDTAPASTARAAGGTGQGAAAASRTRAESAAPDEEAPARPARPAPSPVPAAKKKSAAKSR
jgi:3-dehydroquinate dehydratase/shikimate dehydrogenase